jgi:chromate transport protein ChrA
MAPTSTPARHHYIFRGFDESMTRFLGADIRLLYGMGIPVLVIVGLIILLALNPSTWVVGVIVVLEIAALALIVAGLLELMNDTDDTTRLQ